MKHYISIAFIGFVTLFICFAPGITVPYTTNTSLILTIFDLMFGGVPGLTTAFVFYMFILVSSIVVTLLYFLFKKTFGLSAMIISSGANALFYLLTGILVLCVVPLSVGPNYKDTGYNIGTGSIFFGILNLVLAILSVICIFFLFKEKNALPEIINVKKVGKSNISKSDSNDEENTISLLKEYKNLLDEGIITEEQFNNKRDELLNK